MTLPAEIARLIETFERNRDSYAQGRYSEMQLRREYVDPLFKALGWDVDNTRGWAEAYKDVIHEDAIRIGSSVKAPDYCFRIGGTRKFFVEAKTPSVNLKDDPDPAYQLRRYAWSAKLPLSILTDFEEFAVYDGRVRPHHADKASQARTRYWRYTDYPDHWDEIASIFSYDAVLKGSFDKYATSVKRLHGTAEVDSAFLAEIETWRDTLAHNIAARNPALTNRQLNYAVQITIDRIIFLRICEDRGIERYGQLMALFNGSEVYPRLMSLFRQADDRYNSGLFHFLPEKERPEGPDELTPELAIDDKPLKDILRSLYYPDSPYEFSVLPAEILGQVYEQFLGKVITLTAGHHARVEDKPEVKKAGGVFYTPAYIVDYIVRQTVGKLLEGRSVLSYKTKPPKLDRPLRVLDPACGSGSFLLGAYQRLLDWYRTYYEQHDPDTWAAAKVPPIYQAGTRGWRLTLAERKRILLDHIFGVDIDTQAVEVTKLSLLLRVLEGEKNLVLFHNERALPDLAGNIKCGNSLIGPDFYTGRQGTIFDEDEQFRVNAFDWHAEFPEVFQAGGFDAVIGNPPYVRIQTMQQTQAAEVAYYRKRYASAAKGNYDIYIVFIECSLGLLNEVGRLGFICPHKFFNAQYGQPLRTLLAKGKHVSHLVHFGEQQVFDGATTYTCLLFLDRSMCQVCTVARVRSLIDWRLSRQAIEGTIPAEALSASEWNFSVGPGSDLFEKLRRVPTTLGDVAARIFQGFKTGADPVFILEVKGNSRFLSNHLGESVKLEPSYLRPLVKSGQIKRYHLRDAERTIIFPYRQGQLLEWAEIESMAPATAAYLHACKHVLDSREGGRWAGANWYCYSRTQALEVMESPKILTADLNLSANFCIDHEGTACFPGGAAGGYGIIAPGHNLLYILALLNSKALDWYLRRISSTFRGGWFSYESRFIRHLPIVVPGSSPGDTLRHERIVRLVEALLHLHQSLASAKTPTEKAALERQIAATDAQINQLVYALYGLTDEEIKIVEEATHMA